MPAPKVLVEGVDYYVDDGKFVFTAEYHLKRGHCCNSKCRHCPYGLAPGGPEAGKVVRRIEIAGVPVLPGLPKIKGTP